MNLFYLDLNFVASGYETEDQLETQLDCVLEALYDVEDVIDPDMTARLSTGQVMFSVGVEADDESSALCVALIAIRTAIHVAHGSTPGWEAHFQEIEQTIRAANSPELAYG